MFDKCKSDKSEEKEKTEVEVLRERLDAIERRLKQEWYFTVDTGEREYNCTFGSFTGSGGMHGWPVYKDVPLKEIIEQILGHLGLAIQASPKVPEVPAQVKVVKLKKK